MQLGCLVFFLELEMRVFGLRDFDVNFEFILLVNIGYLVVELDLVSLCLVYHNLGLFDVLTPSQFASLFLEFVPLLDCLYLSVLM